MLHSDFDSHMVKVVGVDASELFRAVRDYPLSLITPSSVQVILKVPL